MLNNLNILLLLTVSVVVFFAKANENQVQCPDCSKVRCALELEQEDCPIGTLLTQNMLFGCCPACVKHLDYDSPCPGIYQNFPAYTGGPFHIKWKEHISTHGDTTGDAINGYDYNWLYYPDQFISATEELPCSSTNLYEDIYKKKMELPERVFSSYWSPSPRNKLVKVPVIDSARCSPHLRCFLTFGELDLVDTSPDKIPYPKCLEPLEAIVDSDQWKTKDYKEMPCTFNKADYSKYLDINTDPSVSDCAVRNWPPSCYLTLGVFAPVQLKSDDANYWCSSPQGKAIFGKEKTSLRKPEINCKCSRKRWELEETKIFSVEDAVVSVVARKDVSLHCELNGNYELLQCDLGRCWCININTGRPLSKIVPEIMVRLLPCFDRFNFKGKFGSKYLRKCESRALGIEKTSTVLRLRGNEWKVDPVKCDPMGGFYRTRCDSSSSACYCVSSDGKTGYTFPSTLYNGPSCSCARDILDNIISPRNCDAVGNYVQLQSMSTQSTLEYCADPEDGWRMSGGVPLLADKTDMTIPLPCCLDSAALRQTWPITEQAYRHAFSCRSFGSLSEEKGLCDNGEYCTNQIKNCALGV